MYISHLCWTDGDLEMAKDKKKPKVKKLTQEELFDKMFEEYMEKRINDMADPKYIGKNKGGMVSKTTTKKMRGGGMAGKAKMAKKKMRGGGMAKRRMAGGGMAKMAKKKMMGGGMAKMSKKKKMMRGGMAKKKK